MFSSGMDVNVRKTEITTNSFKYEPGELYRDPSTNRVYRFVEVVGDGTTATVMAGSPLAFIPTATAGKGAVRSPKDTETEEGLHFAGVAVQTDWAITNAMADTAGIRYGIWAMVASGAKQMGHTTNQDNPAFVPVQSATNPQVPTGLMGFGADNSTMGLAGFTSDTAIETPLLNSAFHADRLWVTFSTGIAKQALNTSVALTDDSAANNFTGTALQVANGTDSLTYGLVLSRTSGSTPAVATVAATAVDMLAGGSTGTIEARSRVSNGYYLNGQY